MQSKIMKAIITSTKQLTVQRKKQKKKVEKSNTGHS